MKKKTATSSPALSKKGLAPASGTTLEQDGSIRIPTPTLEKAILLEMIESPLMVPSATRPGLSDLVKALFILSNDDSAKLFSLISTKQLDQACLQWARTIELKQINKGVEEITRHLKSFHQAFASK